MYDRPDQAMLTAIQIVQEARQDQGDPVTPEEWATFVALLEVKIANAIMEFPPEKASFLARFFSPNGN
jgi:hypothetical protein